MHRCVGRSAWCLLLAGGLAVLCGGTMANAEPAEDPAARAAQLSRRGRFEDAVVAWREAAQASAATGATHGRVSALVQLDDAQQALDAQRTLAEALAAARAERGPPPPAAAPAPP